MSSQISIIFAQYLGVLSDHIGQLSPLLIVMSASLSVVRILALSFIPGALKGLSEPIERWHANRL